MEVPRDEQVPQGVHDRISASLPDVPALLLRAERLWGGLLPPSSGNVAIACVCLQDSLAVFQNACMALYYARWEWHRLSGHEVPGYPENGRHHLAAFVTRQRFDHAANCLYAGMNHLAGAMWHFHEGEEGPLGSDYKSAEQIRKHWVKVGSAPESQPILDAALTDKDWDAVAGYRAKWSHREYPIVEGEYRDRREVVWKDETEPPPPNVLLTHKAGGKVAYVTAGVGNHQYRLPDLMDAGTGALRAAVTASRAFIALVEQHARDALAGQPEKARWIRMLTGWDITGP